MRSLVAGLRMQGGLLDLGFEEILNHLGLFYEKVEDNSSSYQVELSSEDFSRAGGTTLEEIVQLLSGLHDPERDDFMYPVVNEFELKVLAEIKKRYSDCGIPLVRKWYWPNQKVFCVILTHDVDYLFQPPPPRGSLRKTIPSLIRYGLGWLTGDIRVCNVLQLGKREKAKGFISTFFFMVDYGTRTEILGRLVRIPELKEFEVGLHGSPSAADSSLALTKQRSRLEQMTSRRILANRFHYLVSSPPFTWRKLEEAGFTSDCTSCCRESPGFKDGICFPFHPIDIFQERRRTVIEIPTSFMDSPFIQDVEKARHKMNRLLEVVTKFNGCLVLNFHNGYQDPKIYPQYVGFYDWVLETIASTQGVWVANVSDVCKWWLSRERTQLRKNALLYDTAKNDVHIVSPLAESRLVLCVENKEIHKLIYHA